MIEGVSRAAQSMTVSFVVNGERVSVDVLSHHTLADVLREQCGLTGVHLGCEHGVCGACTVLLDDDPVRACLLFAVQVDNGRVTTVEGVGGPDGKLSALQQELGERRGLQCGFCTPGFVMLADALLASNLCRCTGYSGIVDAVRALRDEGGA